MRMDRRFSLDRAMRDHQRRLLLLTLCVLGLAKSGGVPHPPPHPHTQPLAHPPPPNAHALHHPFPHPHRCPEYGGCRENRPSPFLPSQPGITPDCAKDGATFCEAIDHYPQHLIQYLADRLTYDYNTLLSDESREEFKAKKDEPTTPRPLPLPVHPPYGPPFHQNYVHYTYGPPPPQPPSRNPFSAPYPQPQPVYNSINYSQPQEGGYPDRRYPLFPQTYFPDNDPGLVYSALLQPELVAQYQPNSWWKRYSRSQGSTGNDEKLRQRRQSSGNSNTTQLCPTRSQFVMPKAALNNKGNWMYVVNLEQDRYTQLVRSETCVSNQCNGICSLPNGYTSRCEQQYVQKRLVALEGGGNRLYTDVFWFPHCCICQITQNG